MFLINILVKLLIFTQTFSSGFVKIPSALPIFSGKTLLKITGNRKIETTNDVIRVKAIVILNGPINAHTVPVTMNKIGRNINTVINVPGIIDHLYLSNACPVASQKVNLSF